MNKINLTEALIVLLVERGGVDGSNVVTLLRRGIEKVGTELTDIGFTEEEVESYLTNLHESDDLDGIIIMASSNGREDIFA